MNNSKQTVFYPIDWKGLPLELQSFGVDEKRRVAVLALAFMLYPQPQENGDVGKQHERNRKKFIANDIARQLALFESKKSRNKDRLNRLLAQFIGIGGFNLLLNSLSAASYTKKISKSWSYWCQCYSVVDIAMAAKNQMSCIGIDKIRWTCILQSEGNAMPVGATKDAYIKSWNEFHQVSHIIFGAISTLCPYIKTYPTVTQLIRSITRNFEQFISACMEAQNALAVYKVPRSRMPFVECQVRFPDINGANPSYSPGRDEWLADVA